MVEENKKTVLGVTENLEALLCYAVGWVSGLIFLILEKENEYVKFHALQSLVAFGALHAASFVLVFIPLLGWLLSFCISILCFVLWIVLMVKAYKGERYKLPVASDFVEKQLVKK
ncbi:MAG TPA: DUF4870 domain-containing protein [Candidatus Omnitrophota bacterium]|nr:DUF4870 domain-containing protein [Candidatus Omnitrophota bacterium]